MARAWSKIPIVAGIFVLLALCGTTVAQASAEDAPRFRASNLVSQASLLEELNAGGAAGYRLAAIAPNGTGGTAVLMEKAGTNERYEYLIVQGELRKHQLQEQLSAAGERGFKLLPGSMDLNFTARIATVPGAWGVMERAGSNAERCQYTTISPMRFGSAKKDLAQSNREGFRGVWLGELAVPVIITERCPSGGRATPQDEVTRVNAEEVPAYQPPGRIVDLQVSPRLSNPQKYSLGILINRDSAPLGQRIVTDSFEVKGKDGPEQQWAAVESQLNTAAAGGYRIAFAPTLVHAVKGNFHFRSFCNVALVLQRDGDAAYGYRVITAGSLPELVRAIKTQAEQGYRVLPMSLAAGEERLGTAFLIFMEKPPAADAAGGRR